MHVGEYVHVMAPMWRIIIGLEELPCETMRVYYTLRFLFCKINIKNTFEFFAPPISQYRSEFGTPYFFLSGRNRSDLVLGILIASQSPNCCREDASCRIPLTKMSN